MKHGFHPWARKIPSRRKWQPTPVFLPGKFHEQRSLADYSPWGHKELDTSEHINQLYFNLKKKAGFEACSLARGLALGCFTHRVSPFPSLPFTHQPLQAPATHGSCHSTQGGRRPALETRTVHQAGAWRQGL